MGHQYFKSVKKKHLYGFIGDKLCLWRVQINNLDNLLNFGAIKII